MRKSKFSLSFLFSIIIEVLDPPEFNTIFREILNIISLILYFSQPLGFLANFQYDFYDSKLNFLLNLLYYSNFSNFLILFQSSNIVLIIYGVVLFFVGIFYFYFFLLSILKIYFNLKLRKYVFIQVLNGLYSFFFTIFFWCLMIPSLEILTNPLRECGLKTSFLESCSDILNSIYYIPSIFGIIMILILGLIRLYFQNNYKFLDFDEIGLSLNCFSILIFIIRCSIPIFFTTFYENDYLFYLLMHVYAILSIRDYLENFSIRSPILNTLYIRLLFCFEAIILIFTFWRFFNVLIEESLFYIIIIAAALSFKLGSSTSNSKRKSIHISNFNSKNFVDYSLEELYFFLGNSNNSTESLFLMFGMLKFHAKDCKNPECKIKSKTMNKFQDLNINKKYSLINCFILERLRKEVEKQYKNKLNINETIIVKYIGFLIFANYNTWKAYYEAQKIKLFHQNPTFFGKILMKNIMRKVRKKILEIERERGLMEERSSVKALDTNAFFRIYREKTILEILMTKLLKQKIAFWEAYKEGFDCYDDLLKSASNLYFEINLFRDKLKDISSFSRGQNEKIVTLKIFSIFYGVILNKIPETLAYEDEINNIKKKFTHLEKDVMSPIIFLKDSIVVCEASFLNSEGRIIESSKSEKLANFFGYEIQDLKMIDSIHVFMPEFIAEHHQKLVFWGFNKIRKEQISRRNEVLSYAINKEGFIFSIKMYLGFNFHYKDDYVANAAFFKLQESGLEELLLNEEGMILGLNRELFNFFHKEFPTIDNQKLKTICFYSLSPQIKEIIKNEQVFKDRKTIVFRGYVCSLILPINLLELLEFIQFYMTETFNSNNKSISNYNAKSFVSSYNSIKSININKNKKDNTSNSILSHYFHQTKDFNIRLNHFLQKNPTLKNKKDEIRDILQSNVNSLEDLINKFIATNQHKKFRIIVDISFKYHRYGKTDQDFIMMTHILFSKISFEKIEPEIEDMSFSSQASDNIILPPLNNFEFGFEFERVAVNNPVKILITKPDLGQDNDEFNHKYKDELEKKMNNREDLKEEKQLNDKLEESKTKNLIPKEIKRRKISQNLEYSDDSNEIAKKREGFKQTTEQLRIKEMDMAASQPSSTTSTNKKSFNILAIISILIGKIPKSMFYLSYSIIFQFFLILCYSIIYYLFAGQYVTNSYIPLKTSLLDQLQMNQGIAISTTIFTEFENIQKGYSNITDLQYKQLHLILNRSYKKIVSNLIHDRNREKIASDSHYLQDRYMIYVGYPKHEVESMLFSDVTDIFINIINSVIKEESFINHEDMLNVQQRNYIWYLITTKLVRDEIQMKFEGSNNIVTNDLLITLVFAISLVVLCKFIESLLLSQFYKKITRILNIFLRNHAKEAIQEVIFLKEILSIFDNQKKSFMSIDFSDQIFCKKNPIPAIEDEKTNANTLKNISKNNKKTSKKKYALSIKNRNFSLMGLKSFSKLKSLIFILLTSSSAILYFSFNYYFWITCDSQIQNLLTSTDIFNNLYIYSATDLTFNNLLLREQIIRNPLYEATKEKFQIHENRLIQLQYLLSTRMKTLEDALKVLPDFASEAETDLNNELFTKLLKNNICEVLIIKEYITDQEKDFCFNAFDQSFQRGIYSALNSYLIVLKSFNYLTNVSLLITEEDRVKRTEDIKKFINSTAYVDTINSVFLINESLGVFYDYFSEYYLQQLYNNINRLILFIWIMCSICLTFMVLVFVFIWRFLKNMYDSAINTFCFIPIEKLNADEQTIFLIKSLYKDQL